MIPTREKNNTVLFAKRDAGIVAQAALNGNQQAIKLCHGASDHELLQLIEESTKAMDSIVRNHFRLAAKVAIHYAPNNEHDEYIQAAKVSLYDAACTYDTSRGRTFVGYAYDVISWEMKALKRSHNGVFPRGLAKARAQVTNEIDTRIARSEAIDSHSLASTLRMSTSYVDLVRTLQRPASLHSPANEEVIPLPDTTSVREMAHLCDSLAKLDQLLAPVESSMIKMHWGLDQKMHTQKQIAEKLCIAPSTVHRTLVRAMMRLKNLIEAEQNDQSLTQGRAIASPSLPRNIGRRTPTHTVSR